MPNTHRPVAQPAAVRDSATEDWAPPAEDSPGAFVPDVKHTIAGDVIDMTEGVTLDGPPVIDEWDGKSVRFMLGHGIIHNQDFVHAGQKVTFRASKVISVDPETGLTVSKWFGPDGDTVANLLRAGFFAGTEQHAERQNTQTVVDYERGVFRKHDDVDGPPPQGLKAKSSQELRAMLDPMLQGGPVEMKRREKQEARAAGEELTQTLANAIQLAGANAARA